MSQLRRVETVEDTDICTVDGTYGHVGAVRDTHLLLRAVVPSQQVVCRDSRLALQQLVCAKNVETHVSAPPLPFLELPSVLSAESGQTKP
jgi:hypothetical protein